MEPSKLIEIMMSTKDKYEIRKLLKELSKKVSNDKKCN